MTGTDSWGVCVPDLETVTGTGSRSQPYQSPSGTGGLEEAFEALEERGGGIVSLPSGFYDARSAAPYDIDLAAYPSLLNNVSVRGAGIESAIVLADNETGDGIRFVDSTSGGSDIFYTEIRGVRFSANCPGYAFTLGLDSCEDAYNSCLLSLSTQNHHERADGACRLNHVLNTRQFGVHNTNYGDALTLGQFQFGIIQGSTCSQQGVSQRWLGYSFANTIQSLNVEAALDGVVIEGENCGQNTFITPYFANLEGTAFTQTADIRTLFLSPFVGSNVEALSNVETGELRIMNPNAEWEAELAGEPTVRTVPGEQPADGTTDSVSLDGDTPADGGQLPGDQPANQTPGQNGRRQLFDPQSSPPPHEAGRVAVADGDGWKPLGSPRAAIVASDGESWTPIHEFESSF